MVFKKYLLVLSSLACINLTYAACTNSQTCLDDGVNYSNSNMAGAASNINNSVIESAVGADRITDANSTRDSIQNTMGGNYKNIDGMNNAGNTKAAACQGKTTQECSAYNYYNDPLTKQGQDSIKDAVSMASDLINKKITENVEIKGYCASNPNDSICKMCAKDPSQAMCQAGNKCTTISYKSTGIETKHACEIIGQRGYACNSWVDNVISHYDYVPPSPVDGTIINQNFSYSACNRANVNGVVSFVFHQDRTKNSQVAVYAYVDGEGFYGGGSELDRRHAIYTQLSPLLISLNSFSGDNLMGRGRYWGNGHTDATSELHLISNNGCAGNTCVVTFNQVVQSGGDGGCGVRSQTFTVSFAKPTVGYNNLIIDNVIWKDNCAQ
ncbi:MAG: hypothetical protein K2Y14_02475 [Burkholderiales bacterium]|nr:hypothetical protein [Burkholderiales bacterium]